MKNLFRSLLILTLLTATSSAFADGNNRGNGDTGSAGMQDVKKIAAELKANDTRTVINEIDNRDGNPCLSAGKSYNIELQVKTAAYNRMTEAVDYKWETVKTVNVDQDGGIMEACAE